jgi:hypothetical protein
MSHPEGARTPLYQVAGVVEAPVDEVADTAFARIGDVPAGDPHVQIDRAARRYVVQGDWWYRGVCSFEADPRGTLVTYRAYNIARRMRFMVRLILLQYRLNGAIRHINEGGLPELVRTLAEGLGTRGYGVTAAEPGAAPDPARR